MKDRCALGKVLKNPCSRRQLKKVQMPGGAPGTRPQDGHPSEWVPGARRTQLVRRSAARARGHPPQVGHRRWAFFSGLLVRPFRYKALVRRCAELPQSRRQSDVALVEQSLRHLDRVLEKLIPQLFVQTHAFRNCLKIDHSRTPRGPSAHTDTDQRWQSPSDTERPCLPAAAPETRIAFGGLDQNISPQPVYWLGFHCFSMDSDCYFAGGQRLLPGRCVSFKEAKTGRGMPGNLAKYTTEVAQVLKADFQIDLGH